jgi:hypothetical protein
MSLSTDFSMAVQLWSKSNTFWTANCSTPLSRVDLRRIATLRVLTAFPCLYGQCPRYSPLTMRFRETSTFVSETYIDALWMNVCRKHHPSSCDKITGPLCSSSPLTINDKTNKYLIFFSINFFPTIYYNYSC